jgi:hypothetical protein
MSLGRKISKSIMQFAAGPNRLDPKATQLRKSTTAGIPDRKEQRTASHKSQVQSIHARTD